MADWTIRALMYWTEKHFAQKGVESPRLEAQLLLAQALGCNRVGLYTRWDETIDEERRGRFRELIKRRLDGCPVMYLTGRREFYALEFEVTPAVLIPRPETEVLVREALKRLKGTTAPRVLDVGTGSGAIALALADEHPAARVTAVDTSAAALELARENAERLGLDVTLREQGLDAVVEGWDLVVSNPPYVESLHGLQPELLAVQIEHGITGSGFLIATP